MPATDMPCPPSPVQVGWNVPNQGCGSANINYYTYQVVPVGLVAASRQMTQTNDINIVITSLTVGAGPWAPRLVGDVAWGLCWHA